LRGAAALLVATGLVDGDAGQVAGDVEGADLLGVGAAHLAVVHREAADDALVGRVDGRRPAGLETIEQGQILVSRP
jgi:hypothetical protein